LRRDQMRGLVHGRARAVDVPQPTNIVMDLEPLKVDSLLDQRLRRSQPHRPGADQRKLAARRILRHASSRNTAPQPLTHPCAPRAAKQDAARVVMPRCGGPCRLLNSVEDKTTK